MKCKHSKNDVFVRWITPNGYSIKYGSDIIKQEWTCLNCGKTFTRKSICIL